MYLLTYAIYLKLFFAYIFEYIKKLNNYKKTNNYSIRFSILFVSENV